MKAGAIPVWAGVLLRFGYEMQIGDLVVAPNKSDSTLSFGRVAGNYEYVPTAPRAFVARVVDVTLAGLNPA